VNPSQGDIITSKIDIKHFEILQQYFFRSKKALLTCTVMVYVFYTSKISCTPVRFYIIAIFAGALQGNCIFFNVISAVSGEPSGPIQPPLPRTEIGI
jgi:hypothetical protein